MCANCETLAALLIVEEAEAELLETDMAEGLAPAGAVRPLFDHERRAQTRFADLDDAVEAAVEAAVEELAYLHSLIAGALMAALYGGREQLTPALLISRMEEFVASQPEELRKAITASTERLQEVMAASYTLASGQVLSEAQRQGVQPPMDPRSVDPAAYAAAAGAVAAHPWRRITGKVMEEMGKPGKLVGDAIPAETVQKVLDDIKVDGSADLARQSINTASGMGRVETAELLEPAEIWASEIMDGNTCTPCSHVDGKDYKSMEDAREDYPVAGYKGCDGESRCRGTLVFVFPED